MLDARPQDATAAVTQLAIAVEKKLCGLLGREWSAAGISIVSLCDDLSRALQAVGPEPVAQISDEIVDAVREAYRRKVAEYDRDFRDPAMSGEPWKTKYGTNLHSTSLGEQWAMSQALRSALVATPPAETVVEALALALELIERSSFQWTGAGPHPQVVVEKLRALAAKDGRS